MFLCEDSMFPSLFLDSEMQTRMLTQIRRANNFSKRFT